MTKIALTSYAAELFASDRTATTEEIATLSDVIAVEKRGLRWWAHIDGRPTAESKMHGAEVVENDDDEITGYWLPISE